MVKEMFMSRNEFIRRFGVVPREEAQGVEITDAKNEKRRIMFTDTDGHRWALRELRKIEKLVDPRKEKISK